MTPGIMPNGLFWTTPLPRGAYQVMDGGATAHLKVENIPLIETFVFAGIHDAPVLCDLEATWQATADRVPRGKGTSVPRTDPGAFTGNLADARAVGMFSCRTTGFSFESNPGASSDRGWAEFGTERNGAFLS